MYISVLNHDTGNREEGRTVVRPFEHLSLSEMALVHGSACSTMSNFLVVCSICFYINISVYVANYTSLQNSIAFRINLASWLKDQLCGNVILYFLYIPDNFCALGWENI